MFVIEMLACDMQNWLKPVCAQLFGNLSARSSLLETDGSVTDAVVNRAHLLAQLSTNHHSGLSGSERAEAMRRCCEVQVRCFSVRGGVRSENSIIREMLNVPRFRDAVVEQLVDVSEDLQARCINLSHTSLSSVVPLCRMTSVHELSLSGTSIESVNALSGLQDLAYVDLSGTRVVSIASLTGLRGITHLNLSNTPISDLGDVSAMHWLRELVLTNTNVANLEGLESLRSLEALWINGTLITDVGPISNLSRLRYVDLRGTAVTNVELIDGREQLEVIQ